MNAKTVATDPPLAAPAPAGRRRALFAALSLALGLGAALLLGEVAIRIVSPGELEKARARRGEGAEPHPRGLYTLDRNIGWTLTPGFRGEFRKPEFTITVAANADGVRDDDIVAKPPELLRVVTLGDSFAFGWGVEAGESVSKVLERVLDRRPGRRYQVVNCGIPGYGTYEATRLYEARVARYRPDLVLLWFYEGNDYRNNLEAPRARRIVDGYLADAESPRRTGPWPWLARTSRLAGLVELQRTSFATKRGLGDGVARTRDHLATLAAAARERGAALVVVVIPDQDPEVYSRSRLARLYDRMAGGIDQQQARVEVERFCRDSGIAYYRLSKEFEDAPGSMGLRLSENDVHFNARGHEQAAAEVAAFLERDVLAALEEPDRGP